MSLPPIPDAFRWTDEPWGPGLRCIPLEQHAAHVFTTRHLELTSDSGVDCLAAAVHAQQAAMLTQVHGNRVVVIRAGEPQADGRPEGDALVSNDSDTAVAVRAADCVPVLMADTRTGAVAAVHAGWRGTAARVVVATVEALAREFGTRPADIVAAIGPSIGPCCYEVGSELVDAFALAGHERYLIDRWFQTPRLDTGHGRSPRGFRPRPALRLDVAGANRDQMVLAGVPEERIFAAGLCTAMHLDVLTSYRAEKTGAGRIAAAIRSKPVR